MKANKRMLHGKIQENSKEYSGFNVTFGQPDKMYF